MDAILLAKGINVCPGPSPGTEIVCLSRRTGYMIEYLYVPSYDMPTSAACLASKKFFNEDILIALHGNKSDDRRPL